LISDRLSALNAATSPSLRSSSGIGAHGYQAWLPVSAAALLSLVPLRAIGPRSDAGDL